MPDTKQPPEKRTVGRPADVGGKRVQVYLDPESLAIAAKIGAGNVSYGIRKALKQAADAGESDYSAAKADGISLSTSARRRADAETYAYQIGALFAEICATHGERITEDAMANISLRPDLMLIYLSHIDLSGYEIPGVPQGWRSNDSEQSNFWIGYYHGRAELLLQGFVPGRVASGRQIYDNDSDGERINEQFAKAFEAYLSESGDL